MTPIDTINLAFCRLRDVPACRYCQIPCDPSTREYRGAGVCVTCYDDLGKLVLVKKVRNHAAK